MQAATLMGETESPHETQAPLPELAGSQIRSPMGGARNGLEPHNRRADPKASLKWLLPALILVVVIGVFKEAKASVLAGAAFDANDPEPTLATLDGL